MRRQFDAACRQYEAKTLKLTVKNLLDLDGSDYGFVNDTGWYTDSGRHNRHTKHLPVKPDTVYTIWANRIMYNIGVAFFDSGDAYISRSDHNNTATRTVTTPSNAAYICVWFHPDYGIDVTAELLASYEPMLLVGSHSKPPVYEPYGGTRLLGWRDGLKSGFPSVKMLGKTEQQRYAGKNLFDISRLNVQAESANDAWISEIGAEYIIVSEPEGYVANGGFPTGKTLREVAPELVSGKTYTLSFSTESTRQQMIYLVDTAMYWGRNTSATVTEEMLASGVYLYGKSVHHGEEAGGCRISNIQIEEGTAVTGYEPYVGGTSSPSPFAPQKVKMNNSTVRCCGKNLLNLDLHVFNATPVWGTVPKSGLFESATKEIRFKPNTQYTVSTEAVLPKDSDGVTYFRFDYTDGSRSPFAGFELVDARVGIDGHRVLTSYPGKSVSRISIEAGTAGQYEVLWIQIEEGNAATDYEPYFDGGSATAPNLMCAANGSRQSTYDPQTGVFVNWWWDKTVFDGSENWAGYPSGKGFYSSKQLPEEASRTAYWCNMARSGLDWEYPVGNEPFLCCGSGNKLVYFCNNPFFDETKPFSGADDWRAYLKEHPMEVWMVRKEPEITNIGAQRLTCPTGYGQIIQTAGDVPDRPLEVKYLAHGGNVK